MKHYIRSNAVVLAVSHESLPVVYTGMYLRKYCSKSFRLIHSYLKKYCVLHKSVARYVGDS